MDDPRPDRELAAQSLHVFWHLCQLLRLATHIEGCRRDGRDVMHAPLDAAALEAFLVNARALVEFFWAEKKRYKDGRARYPEDARASDWFLGPGPSWDAGPMPAELRTISDRVGWGVAHVSFRRIDPAQEWGWKHLEIGHHLAVRCYEFALAVPKERVAADFDREVLTEVMGYRTATDEPAPFEWLRNPPGPVGTPMHPESLEQLRVTRADDH